MHPLIIPVICTLAGAYFLLKNTLLLRDEARLNEFLNKDPRGRFWSKKLGTDRMMGLTKKVLLPLGMMVSLALLLVGGWSLYHLVPGYL